MPREICLLLYSSRYKHLRTGRALECGKNGNLVGRHQNIWEAPRGKEKEGKKKSERRKEEKKEGKEEKKEKGRRQ